MNTSTLTALGLVVALLAAGPAWADEDEMIWRDGKWVRLAGPVEGTPAGEAAIIRRHVDRKEFSAAVKATRKFVKRYPASDLREEVFFLAGESQMRRGDYWQALKWYEKQLTEFPNRSLSERAVSREMEIARAFLSGKKRKLLKMLPLSAKGEGIAIMERIAERAPSTEHAELALLAVGDYYFDEGDWAAAVDSYDGYLLLFAKSPRVAHAELRAAESLRRSYHGASWDETPLLEAEQRYKRFARKYPLQARKAGVEAIVKEIRSLRAAKLLEIARFYQRTDKPAAARYYLQLLAKEFPDTRSAVKAQPEAPASKPADADKTKEAAKDTEK